MAKLVGNMQFVGKLRNDVGFIGEDGKVFVRSGDNNPSNPNTAAQIVVRTKFALAAQLSKLVPRELIVGFQKSARKNRASFVKNIIGNSTIDDSRAELEPEKLVFSTGRSFILHDSIVATVVNDGVQRPYVSASITTTDWPDDLAAINVIAVECAADKSYTRVESAVLTKTHNSAQIAADRSIATAQIYTIPVVKSPTADRVAYDKFVSDLNSGAEYSLNAAATISSLTEQAHSVYETQATQGA